MPTTFFCVSSNSKAKARNSSSASELWDSVLATPVANLKNKLKKRPSFVDEDQKWNLDTERILGGIIFCLIIVSFMMAGFITYAAFRGPKVEDDFSNGKYDSMKYALSQSTEQPPAPAVKELVVEKDFLLKDDVSIEEVLEYKRILEDEYGNQEVFVEEDIIYQDIYSPEARPYAVKDVVKPVDAERASKSILEEAEKLLEEETRLLKDVSNRLESFVSNSRMISNDINQIFDDNYVYENSKGEDFQYVDEDNMGQNFEVFPQKEHIEVDDDVDVVNKDTDASEVKKSSEEADNTRQAQAQASIKVKPPKTRNRNPLTKSVKVQKMSKPKTQKKTSDRDEDVSEPEVGELTFDEKVRKPEAETDGQEVEDYEKDIDLEEYENEYVDYVESGEDRVKRSRFGRDKQKTKIMRFRKYKSDNKNDDKNDFYLRNNDNDKVRRRKVKINGGNDY